MLRCLFQIVVRNMNSVKALFTGTLGAIFFSLSASAHELGPVYKFGEQPPAGIEDYGIEDPPEDTKIPTLVLAHQQPIAAFPGLTLWTYKMYGLCEMKAKTLRVSFQQNPYRVGLRQLSFANRQVVPISKSDLQKLKFQDSLYEKVTLENGAYIFEKRIPANTNTMLISIIASTDFDERRKKVLVSYGNEKTKEYLLAGPHIPGQEPRLNRRIREGY